MQTLPPRIDFFALIMLLGIAQGLFLGLFFLTGQRGRGVANRCLGWAMLAISGISTEIFLDYTNYTFRVLWLVDFAEPLNFLPGPLLFLFIYSRIHQRLPRFWWLHLLPFAVWVLNSFSWHYQPLVYKYNSYLESVHPEMPLLPWQTWQETDFTGLREYINEMTLLSCLLYNLAGFAVVRRAYRQAGQPLWGFQPTYLAQLRNLVLLFIVFPVLIVVVKPFFYEDLGDYLLACYVTFAIYGTSILVMSGSEFFRAPVQPQSERSIIQRTQSDFLVQATGGETGSGASDTETLPEEPRRKYEKSLLSEEVEEALLARLIRLSNDEKPYLESDLSLPGLARRLQTSPHHLSQLLNDRLDQSFFDWLAFHRVREAQQLLQNPAMMNLKIDEIAAQVGYNSTSAFHTAFKRLTGQTPAQFRDAATSA